MLAPTPNIDRRTYANVSAHRSSEAFVGSRNVFEIIIEMANCWPPQGLSFEWRKGKKLGPPGFYAASAARRRRRRPSNEKKGKSLHMCECCSNESTAVESSPTQEATTTAMKTRFPLQLPDHEASIFSALSPPKETPS